MRQRRTKMNKKEKIEKIDRERDRYERKEMTLHAFFLANPPGTPFAILIDVFELAAVVAVEKQAEEDEEVPVIIEKEDAVCSEEL
jgi:hypothetical protein